MSQQYGFNPYNAPSPVLNYIPQSITPYTPSAQEVGQQEDQFLSDYLKSLEASKQQSQGVMPNMGISTRNTNILNNALQDIKDMGTGLVGMATHPVQYVLNPLGKEINKIGNIATKSQMEALKKGGSYSPIDQLKDYTKATKTLGSDVFNFLAANYDVTTQDIKDVVNGKQSARDVAGRAVANAYAHPVYTGLDVLGVGGAIKGAVKGSKAVAKEARSAARIVEDNINTTAAKVRSKMYPVLDQANELQAHSEADLAKAVEALETGKEITDKTVVKKLSKLVDLYDNAVPEYAKVDKEELALSQKLVREGKANSIAEAQKILLPYKEEVSNIPELAKKGDKVAQSIIEGHDAYNKGYLKLVPHGLAEVQRTAVGKVMVDDMENRIFAGQYSTRAWGTAEYQDIAKQLTNPFEWADAQTKQWIEQGLAEEINKGTLGGKPLVSENTKKVKYIEPVTGEGKQVNLQQIVDNAADKPITANSIPVDADVLKELNNQLRNMRTQPFSNQLANDIYQVSKTNLLGTGGYLAGNLQTGLANALMNNGLNPIEFARDLGDAIQTKGALAKETGIYRRTSEPLQNRVKTPVLHEIARLNAPVSNAFNAIDARVQNLFSEMALNHNLRNQGIKVEQRAETLQNMDKMKLAEAIHDAKAISLINPTKTILPAQATSIVSLSNPFWRWMDTAAQSSYHMFKKQPALSALLLAHVAGNIGIDQEMQNRLGLGVTSDKAFVSYRYNPQTKKVEEISCEFTPQLNTMKLIGEAGDAIAKGDYTSIASTFGTAAVPFFGAVSSAIQGKNRYGKPIVRPEMDRRIANDLKFIQGDKRYEYRAGEGYVEKKGGYADEVLHTALNELIVYPKLYNRTVAPLLAGLTGQRYYKPYANQFTGEYAPVGQAPQNANPRSSAALENVMDILKGQYATYYNPLKDVQKSNAGLGKQLLRGQAKRMGLNEMLINQYGGGQ